MEKVVEVSYAAPIIWVNGKSIYGGSEAVWVFAQPKRAGEGTVEDGKGAGKKAPKPSGVHVDAR